MNTVGGAGEGLGEGGKLLGRKRQAGERGRLGVAGEHRLGGQRHELESEFFYLPATKHQAFQASVYLIGKMDAIMPLQGT